MTPDLSRTLFGEFNLHFISRQQARALAAGSKPKLEIFLVPKLRGCAKADAISRPRYGRPDRVRLSAQGDVTFCRRW